MSKIFQSSGNLLSSGSFLDYFKASVKNERIENGIWFADSCSHILVTRSCLVEGCLPLESRELSTHLEDMSRIRAGQGYNRPSKLWDLDLFFYDTLHYRLRERDTLNLLTQKEHLLLLESNVFTHIQSSHTSLKINEKSCLQDTSNKLSCCPCVSVTSI